MMPYKYNMISVPKTDMLWLILTLCWFNLIQPNSILMQKKASSKAANVRQDNNDHNCPGLLFRVKHLRCKDISLQWNEKSKLFVFCSLQMASLGGQISCSGVATMKFYILFAFFIWQLYDVESFGVKHVIGVAHYDCQREGFHQSWRFLSLGRNTDVECSLVEPWRSWGVVGSAAGGSVVGGWGKRGRGKHDGKTKKRKPLWFFQALYSK